MSSKLTMSSKAAPPPLSCWSASFWKLRVAELRKDPETTKIWTMRLVLACFLIATAAGISISSYNRLLEGQKKSFDSNFYSAAQNALNTVSDSFERLNLGILQLAATYGEVFPEQEQWPNVAWGGFHKIVEPLSKIASLQALAVFSMVRRNQAANFTQHLRDYYESRPDEYALYFNTYMLNHSIWAQNNSLLTSVPFDVTVGITPPKEFFVPVLQYTISPLADKYYAGYDAHYDVRYVGGIETVINCANAFPYEASYHSCAGITDVTPLPWYSVNDTHPDINDMTAAYIHPIFPSNNHSRLVGFAAGTLSWATMLTKVTPTFVHPIDCVVQAHHAWFTFTIIRGVPKFKGFGDLHETKFSRYAMGSDPLSPSLNHADVNSHRLTLYPTQKFYDAYYNFAPLRAALVMIAIFALCSVLFYIYDILMKREFSRRQAVLDTKRRFVRFISHEIRTPLNTVRLGLKLFEEELRALQHKIERSPETALTITVKESLVAWRGLTEEILESSDSAVEVLDDLLNYDKIEIGTLRLEFGLFDVRELVAKCTSLMQVHAKQKGIVLDLQFKTSNPGKIASPRSVAWAESPSPVGAVSRAESPDVNFTSLEEARGTESVVVVGDATRLSQVLRNLISNALKFTPSKGVVTVAVHTATAIEPITEKVRLSSPLFQNLFPAGTAFVAIKDSGAGLTEQQLAQIGMEGVQFNANELQAGQGSGLGLFISKGIVEQHGGRLTVASEGLGKGVTFTVELPLFGGSPQRRDSQVSASRYSGGKASVISVVSAESGLASASIASVQSFGASADPLPGVPVPPGLNLPEAVLTPKKLMVVDDSPFNRKMLVRLLTSKGFECCQAEDGSEAVKLYEEMSSKCEPIDAVLMDFEMPVMNGPTATKKLRELGCTCLIVGVTGNVLPDQVASFKSHGADAVLPKPLVMEDLQFLLSRHQAHTPISPALRLLMKSQHSTTDFSSSARASNKIHPVEG